MTALRSLLLCWFTTAISSADAQVLTLARTIALPEVEGRLDHLAVDLRTRRLFVAALGADKVEVIDLDGAKPIASVQRLSEPQGVAYLDRGQRLVVANGGGSVETFEGERRTAHIGDLDDADNVRVERTSGQVYVGYSNGLAVLDAAAMRIVRRITLRAHPEAFELSSTGPEIYVNVPGAAHVAVIDRDSGRHWRSGRSVLPDRISR